MNILYIITDPGLGIGGHIYDCITTSEAYNELNSVGDRVSICYIGKKISPVIKKSILMKHFIASDNYNYFKVVSSLKKIIKEYDIIQAFDTISFSYARSISFMYNIPIILTKCGGPNVKILPFSLNVLTMSQENYDYLKADKKYKASKIELIPNRIETEENTLIDNKSTIFSDLKSKNFKIVLRISRISLYYLTSLLETISIFKRLHALDSKLRLIIIGSIDNQECHNKLIKAINNYNNEIGDTLVYLLTENIYTLNASRYICCSDLVIGTGRCAMEAIAAEIPLFIVLENNSGTILFNKETAAMLEYYNYSGRYSESQTCLLDNYSIYVTIKQILHDKNYKEDITVFYNNYAHSKLFVIAAISKYMNLYRSVNKKLLWPFTLDNIVNVMRSKRSYDGNKPIKNIYLRKLLRL